MLVGSVRRLAATAAASSSSSASSSAAAAAAAIAFRPWSSARGALAAHYSSRAADAFDTTTPQVRKKREQHLQEALRIVHAYSVGRYEESVDMVVRLNVDAKRSDERVRGTAMLPHGNGKSIRVAVFARGEDADEARAAGADVIGAEDLVEEVLKGRLDFERCLATPEVLPALARAARTLGPKGLMPNPKRGTVTTEVGEAVRRAKGGEVEFRADKFGLVHSSVGRATFSHDQLCDNTLEMLKAILAQRPQRFRGKPPTSIYLLSTTGPGVKLDHRLW